MRFIQLIALVTVLAAMLTTACGDDALTNITLRGRGLTMNVSEMQVVDGIIYQDTDSQYYSVGPAMEGHNFIAARVTIWNIRSGLLSLNVDEDAARLDGTDGERSFPVDPYERRVKLDAPPAALSPHLPFLWGPSELPEDFNISGWMVFELPVGTEIRQLRWEQVDALRFPIELVE